MAGKISNPRDLVVFLLGELLYVERRLAGGVLQELAKACSDTALATALNEHLAETRLHVERVEIAFRRIEVAPTANLSASFESAVSEHDRLAGSIVSAGLGDAFHAATGLRTEHWEIATYTSVLAYGDEAGYRDELADLSASLHEEEHARDILLLSIAQLAKSGRR
jgi:ferritin-like metal-binding protein YciE